MKTCVIQKSSIERRSESVLANMKWWLPLVIVVAVVLLTVIGIVVSCVWDRKKNGRKEDHSCLVDLRAEWEHTEHRQLDRKELNETQKKLKKMEDSEISNENTLINP
ncbi:hypothetical protein BLNAU_17967 [Blattamonas nauphoetae]|uniref:Uncharacterized protein n=1 Tax=Blattamonas nauphoetae TaxID=2049346 RepID=A0ABQ9X600_9EUKA|nr:hypothetical protein BLNAU_17967 [Blattamonas nauphoetae]